MLKMLMGLPGPVADYPFPRSDVASYTRLTPAAAQIDEQTWRDLLLDDYLDRLAGETSIFGQQILHHRLRGRVASAESVARVQALVKDDAARDALHATCSDLRRADAEIADVLFGAGPQASPGWCRHLHWLSIAFLASLVLTLLYWPCCVLTGILWCALMVVQVRYYEQSQKWERLMAVLRQQLRVHTLLGTLPAVSAGACYAAAFRPGAAQAGRVSRTLGPAPMERLLPGAREYGEWVLLTNIRRYCRNQDDFLAQRAFLRGSYELVAALEADIALARHLRRAPVACWASVTDAAAAELQLDGVIHPLLPDPAPLTIALQGQGAFISGQNGIGKSTLLRTVGLNLVCARAFGFCYAHAARVPLLPVYASMQSADSLASGESLYIAELRRARELLALAGQGRAIFLIDEIFRGTNHLESVSAAAAVLDALAQSGTVLVSSHNLVLAPLLAHRLVPLCVGEECGQLRVLPGVLARTNGLSLLGAHGFSPQVEAQAARVHAWLSGYMAHPGDSSGVLDALTPARHAAGAPRAGAAIAM
jgi:hypothetical protein